MAKSRKRKKRKTTTKVAKKKELNIKDEIKYIIKCARNFETKIVSIKELILFSTESGDAWLLDTDDHLALNLSKDGMKQEFTIIDTPYQFGIDWKFNYMIEDEKFITIDESGVRRTVIGYPTGQILDMIAKSSYLNSRN